MKKKALFIGMMLMLVVPLMVGCGGVSQDEFDTAVAARDTAQAQVTTLQSQLNTAQSSLTAANTAKTKAETDLATVQASLTKANSDLTASKAQVTSLTAQVSTLTTQVADLQKQITDLQAQIAALQAGGGGGTTPPPAFTGTKYSDTTYGFSFTYPSAWTEKTASLTPNVIKQFGQSASYYVPTIYVAVLDQSVATNLEGAFKAYLQGSAGAYTFKSFTGTSVTISGVACTKADIVYTGAYGDLDGTMVGFTKNSKWVLIGVVEYPGLGAAFENATQENDIINSITFP